MKRQKIVFVDNHHGDLFHSLWLLFEKRLGWKLYTYYGTEWWDQGYWKYNNQFDTSRQFLYPMGTIEDKNRDENCTHFFPGGYCRHLKGDVYYRGMTLQEFIDADIDIIIASIYQHEIPFFQLRQKYKPDAKLIRQTGNPLEPTDFGIYKNQLCSSMRTYFHLPNFDEKNMNKILYHQEFDTNLFYYTPCLSNKIKSFVNCMNDIPIAKELWHIYKNILPELKFYMHGNLGDDGIVLPDRIGVAQAIQDSTFIWNIKPQGDGFGYAIHYAYACGRPVITRLADYSIDLPGLLMEDNVTAIDIGNCSTAEGIGKIKNYLKPENYEILSKNAYQRFKQVVDYDKEFEEIKKFLNRLI